MREKAFVRSGHRLIAWIAGIATLIAGLVIPSIIAAPAYALSATVITHVPVTSGTVGQPVAVTASTACQTSTSCPLDLVFRTTGGGANPVGAWQRIAMSTNGAATEAVGISTHPWKAEIPATAVDSTGVDYYLESAGAQGVVTTPIGVVQSGVFNHVDAKSPPRIQHTPPIYAEANAPIKITASSSCMALSCPATLFYRKAPAQGVDPALDAEPNWPTKAMTVTDSKVDSNGVRTITYEATIPASDVTTTGVDYFIKVADGSATAYWPGTSYQGYVPRDGTRIGFMHVFVLGTPSITHTPVLSAAYRASIPINASATCSPNVTCTATLYWRTTDSDLLDAGAVGAGDVPALDLGLGGTTDPNTGEPTGGGWEAVWHSAPMTVTPKGGSSPYEVNLTGQIPSTEVDTRGVDYFIGITDAATTGWWPGTTRIDAYAASIPGLRVAYQHIYVQDPPSAISTTPLATKADTAFDVKVGAHCVTEKCEVDLFYARRRLGATGDSWTFKTLPMTRTGNTVASGFDEYKATIPASDVTTRGIVWFAHVFDGYTNAYTPGTPYSGAYIPVDGARFPGIDDIDLPLLLEPVGNLLNIPALGTLELGIGRTIGDNVISNLNVYPVRVLEPPHVVHVPTLVTPLDEPMKLTATSSCAYPCVGTVEWLDTNGQWQSDVMSAQSGTPNTSTGLTPWTFSGEVPDTATRASSVTYRITVDDGYVEDTTPSYVATTNNLVTTGVVTGRVWYEIDGDGIAESGEPLAPGTVVKATPTLNIGGLITRTATTDSKGRYKFPALLVGSYKITVPTPPPGGGATGSTSHTVTVTLNKTTGKNFTFVPLDTDNDGIADRIESAFGLNPSAGQDSDGDGLKDAFEIRYSTGFHDANKADTNANGTPDGAEDVDGDGLTALQEQAKNGRPGNPDTDGDGVKDGVEAADATKLDKADSDDDKSSDAAEERNSTDPLDPDTDNDGILDGDEVTESTTTRLGATVTLLGHGDLGGALSIKPLAAQVANDRAPGQVSEPVEVHLPPEATAKLDSATLKLKYDPTKVTGSPNNLRVFTWDADLAFWVPAGTGQSVDTTNNTVTTTVPHFSIFAIFDLSAWRQGYQDQVGHCVPAGKSKELDVALVLDSSGSMTTNDPNGIRKSASVEFIQGLYEGDRAAVVDFDTAGTLLQPLTTNKTQLTAAINSVDDVGGTDIGAGVSTALSALAANTDSTRMQSLVLITDGEGSYNPALTQQAKTAGVTIYTIGIGSSVDQSLLTSIAEETGGTYTGLGEVNDLPSVMESIAGGTDSDDDGVPDCVETTGVTTGFLLGKVYTSDPHDPDTDDDGLLDGDEIVGITELLDTLEELVLGGVDQPIVLYIAQSDPRTADTDGDGLDDPAETDIGTSLFQHDSDNDGLTDLAEVDEHGTDPDNSNTDADDRDDGWEVSHASAGFNPIVYDEETSKFDYAADFARGLTCPDGWTDNDGFSLFSVCQGDSIAFLVATITGGFFGYKDVIDAIGALTDLDVVSFGIAALSLVPIAGDAGAVVSKTVKFINRVSARRVLDTLGWVARSGKLPLSVKLQIFKLVDGGSIKTIRGAGITDEALIAFSKNRLDFRVLARGLEGAARTPASPKLFAREKDAENYLRGITSGALPKQKLFRDPSLPPGSKSSKGGRYPDVYSPTSRLAIETKNGFIKTNDFIRAQVRKDKALLDDPNTPIDDVEWHFFPRTDGSVGPDDELRELLQQNGIPYTIHTP